MLLFLAMTLNEMQVTFREKHIGFQQKSGNGSPPHRELSTIPPGGGPLGAGYLPRLQAVRLERKEGNKMDIHGASDHGNRLYASCLQIGINTWRLVQFLRRVNTHRGWA